MGNTYPTALDYRGRGGTIRNPAPRRDAPGPRVAPPRRKPGRPPARVRPTYRPGIPPSAPVPKLPANVSTPKRVPGLRIPGLGPYGLAFGVGYALGLIIFGGYDELLIDNPAGWTEYICPGGGGPGTLVGPTTTIYTAGGAGSSVGNCIAGQFVSGAGNILRQGYWRQYGPGANDHAHVMSFFNTPAATPIPSLREVRIPQPLADPFVEEWVGPGVYLNPLLAPVAIPGFLPNVWPRPGPVWGSPKPSPGVGSEGYSSGEPTMGQQPGVGTKPVPLPLPQPFPSRPPKGTKEHKVRSKLQIAAGSIYGTLTEMEDLIDAIHKAIRKGCGKKAGPVWDPSKRGYGADGKSWYLKPGPGPRSGRWVRQSGAYRKPSALEKLNAILSNWDCVDAGQALINIVENQIEDRVLSSGSKAMKKASKRRYAQHMLGYGLGPAL